MRYKRFEELPVWLAAIELSVGIYSLTSRPEFNGHLSLRDQIERAGVSVSNNIAEGFERGTNKELVAFLYIARGSAGEVRSMLCLLQRLAAFAALNHQINLLKPRAESCSRQLKGWLGALQNSDLNGERFVNQRARRASKESREREEFLEELKQIRNRDAKSSQQE